MLDDSIMSSALPEHSHAISSHFDSVEKNFEATRNLVDKYQSIIEDLNSKIRALDSTNLSLLEEIERKNQEIRSIMSSSDLNDQKHGLELQKTELEKSTLSFKKEQEIFEQNKESFAREKEQQFQDKERFAKEKAQFKQDKENIMKENEQLLQDKENFAKEKEQFVLDKENIMKENEQFLQDKESFAKENEQVLNDKENFAKEKEQLLQNKENIMKENEQLLNDKESFAKEKEQFLQDKEIFAKEKDQFMQDKENTMKENEQLLQDKENFAKEKEQFVNNDQKQNTKEASVEKQKTEELEMKIPPLIERCNILEFQCETLTKQNTGIRKELENYEKLYRNEKEEREGIKKQIESCHERANVAEKKMQDILDDKKLLEKMYFSSVKVGMRFQDLLDGNVSNDWDPADFFESEMYASQGWRAIPSWLYSNRGVLSSSFVTRQEKNSPFVISETAKRNKAEVSRVQRKPQTEATNLSEQNNEKRIENKRESRVYDDAVLVEKSHLKQNENREKQVREPATDCKYEIAIV